MLPENFLNEKIFRAVLSGPGKNAAYRRIEITCAPEKFQAAAFTQTQVFHSNHPANHLRSFLAENFGANFSHYTAWDGEFEYSARVTKKGKVLSGRKKCDAKPPNLREDFSRQKNRILREGENVPALVEMGVFTQENRVAAHMQDKFRQINRFLELLADETAALPTETPINIIDLGCGKSYLTFVMHHYFATKLRHPTNICGLDSNADLIEKCTAAAKNYPGLTFKTGDIAEQTTPPLETWATPGSFNIVVSLHACDTATDHALHNAIKWNADLICAAPCCQHEVRNQFAPKTLKVLARHGIIKERIAALATDVIRAELLELHGYKAQIIEFIAQEHTQKNLLIRAKKSPQTRTNTELNALISEFSLTPKLLQLLE